MTYRKSLVKTKGSDLNRLQKMLEGANIKLSGTARDINGKSSRVFLARLLDGKKIDASTVQEMYDRKEIAHNLKANNAQLADDLNGVMTLLQRKLMREVIAHIDELLKLKITNKIFELHSIGAKCKRRNMEQICIIKYAF